MIGCGYYPILVRFSLLRTVKISTLLTPVYFPTVGADGICSLEANFGQKEFKYRQANGMRVAGLLNTEDKST